MNNTLLALLVIAVSTVFYLPAHWTKFAWSGRGFTKARNHIMLIYNILMIIYHSYLIESGRLFSQESLLFLPAGFLSAALILFHGLAIPREHKNRRWRWRNRFDPKIRRHKKSIHDYRREHRKKRG
ncbi:hypothetical protein ASF84_24695 [Pseudomonas sp. Leaf127]|uniref:hypothetical protein n=1 Tax=Pseudomonas sp. Leaf127 TaxID=1736267 RepID=UPI000702B103|nr:hypothetical protein [Pseudomonas sp. Leaf127]KQQ66508.1 hypothetical protein ASF84_24695 [Pseudomonas sp. Leaf127]